MRRLLAREQGAELIDLALERPEADGAEAEREPPGEARADGQPQPPRRQRGERPRRRRGRDRRAQPRHEDADAQTDASGALSGQGECDEGVVVEQRRVVDPRAVEAEVLGEPDVLGRGGDRREHRADPRRPAHRRLSSSPAIETSVTVGV